MLRGRGSTVRLGNLAVRDRGKKKQKKNNIKKYVFDWGDALSDLFPHRPGNFSSYFPLFCLVLACRQPPEPVLHAAQGAAAQILLKPFNTAGRLLNKVLACWQGSP